MYFRRYSKNSDTLKEWARQLNVVNKGSYQLYPTVESTLSHWKSILNNAVGVNTFDLSNNADSTINNWKEKLNGIYNK
jgi:hypothetical protein